MFVQNIHGQVAFLLSVQEMIGCGDIAMTQIYAHTTFKMNKKHLDQTI
jgi:site-specific recombinase XerC